MGLLAELGKIAVRFFAGVLGIDDDLIDAVFGTDDDSSDESDDGINSADTDDSSSSGDNDSSSGNSHPKHHGTESQGSPWNSYFHRKNRSFKGSGKCFKCDCMAYDGGLWANGTRCVCKHLRSDHGC